MNFCRNLYFCLLWWSFIIFNHIEIHLKQSSCFGYLCMLTVCVDALSRLWVGLWQHLVAAGEHTHFPILQLYPALTHIYSTHALVILYPAELSPCWCCWCELSVLPTAHSGTAVSSHPYLCRKRLPQMHNSNTTCDSSTTHDLSNTQMLHSLNTEYSCWSWICMGEKKMHVYFLFLYTLSIGIFVFSEYLLHYVFAVGPYGCFHFCQFYLVSFELCCAAALF